MIRISKTKCPDCGSYRIVFRVYLVKENPEKRKWSTHVFQHCGKCFKQFLPIRQDDALVVNLNSWFEEIAKKLIKK